MKPNSILVQRTGDLGGDVIEFSMDENSLVHLTKMWADLYSDIKLAIIRELATNARDSHVEAGQLCPIEVMTPNSLSPFLRIKDYGLGMNRQDIADIYSKFGASTKRDSDDVTGLLGVGSKSPFAYTGGFKLEATKDGITIIAALGRNEAGLPTIEIMDERPTNADNGVEIMIPVAVDHNAEFLQKAIELFSYWPEGSVILNGLPVPRVDGEWLVKDEIMMIRGSAPDMIVMGGVPYPVESGYRIYMHGSYQRPARVIVWADMGAVNFPPSREALQYTPLTLETLKQYRDKVATTVLDTIQKEVNKATTGTQAMEIVDRWHQLVGFRDTMIEWKGRVVPKNGYTTQCYQSYTANQHKAFEACSSVGRHTMAYHPTIIGAPLDADGKLNSSDRRKVKTWATIHGHTNLNIFHERPPRCWYPDAKQIIKWDSIVLPKGALDPTYTVKTIDATSLLHDTLVSTIDQSKPIYYCSTNGYTYFRAVAELLGDGAICVPLGDNRVAKFRRHVPSAIPLNQAVQALLDEAAAKVKKTDLAALKLHDGDRAILHRLNPARCDDPDLQEMVKLAKIAQGAVPAVLTAYEELASKTRHLPGIRRVDLRPSQDDKSWLKQFYPLLGESDMRYGWTLTKERSVEHVYCYVNAVYGAGLHLEV